VVTNDSTVAVLREALPGASVTEVPAVDMPALLVDRADVIAVCRTLRDHPALQFALLVDVTAADYLPAEPRFEVVYHLACVGDAYVTGASAAPARRLRLKVRVSGEDAELPSIVSIYPGANWLEREVFDLFGLSFEGHPDLRRILMPDDWEGYPLRKDAAVQIRKDTASWSPLQLTAEEFARNIRTQREESTRQAEHHGPTEPSGG
jgi:NADH-quinone oxidoreductase subunit C